MDKCSQKVGEIKLDEKKRENQIIVKRVESLY